MRQHLIECITSSARVLTPSTCHTNSSTETTPVLLGSRNAVTDMLSIFGAQPPSRKSEFDHHLTPYNKLSTGTQCVCTVCDTPPLQWLSLLTPYQKQSSLDLSIEFLWRQILTPHQMGWADNSRELLRPVLRPQRIPMWPMCQQVYVQMCSFGPALLSKTPSVESNVFCDPTPWAQHLLQVLTAQCQVVSFRHPPQHLQKTIAQ